MASVKLVSGVDSITVVNFIGVISRGWTGEVASSFGPLVMIDGIVEVAVISVEIGPDEVRLSSGTTFVSKSTLLACDGISLETPTGLIVDVVVSGIRVELAAAAESVVEISGALELDIGTSVLSAIVVGFIVDELNSG